MSATSERCDAAWVPRSKRRFFSSGLEADHCNPRAFGGVAACFTPTPRHGAHRPFGRRRAGYVVRGARAWAGLVRTPWRYGAEMARLRTARYRTEIRVCCSEAVRSMRATQRCAGDGVGAFPAERRDGVASATIGLGDAPGAAPSSGGSSALVIDAATSRASERARRSRWTGAPCRYRSTWVASGTVGSGGCARRRTVASVVSLASFDRCSAPEHIAERAQRVRAERAQHVR